MFRYRIGVDLDNTLVCYDDVLYREACARGLIDAQVPARKHAIRDWVWRLPAGEEEWQGLQAVVYGAAIDGATLMSGTEAFFRRCRADDVPVVIISHKTVHAARDAARTDLRRAAMRWLTTHRVFDPDGLGLSPEHVYFESTRQAKIARIIEQHCTHFIDDLEETFLEQDFPSDVQPILYRPHGEASGLPQVRTMRSWQEIHAFFFSRHAS